MPARVKKNLKFMNATDRVLERCAVAAIHVRKKRKIAVDNAIRSCTVLPLPDCRHRSRQWNDSGD